jgi:hypothetical protein
MKIIKEFQDHDFLKSAVDTPEDHIWIWGLGDDGWVYYKSNAYDLDQWSIYGYSLSLRTMKKIVKEFGHLVVFI